MVLELSFEAFTFYKDQRENFMFAFLEAKENI